MNLPKPQSLISQTHLDQAMDYKTYRQLIDNLLIEGKTTGTNQSEQLTEYTKLNAQRMNRWDKTAFINPELQQAISTISEKWTWLILTEGWCGDAAQSVPVIVKMANLNPNIEVKFILRDENLDIMDAYLTNGGRAIPKLICLKTNTLEEIFTWGPRPVSLQNKVMEERQKSDYDKYNFAPILHKWYADNKSIELQSEFLKLIQESINH